MGNSTVKSFVKPYFNLRQLFVKEGNLQYIPETENNERQ